MMSLVEERTEMLDGQKDGQELSLSDTVISLQTREGLSVVHHWVVH